MMRRVRGRVRRRVKSRERSCVFVLLSSEIYINISFYYYYYYSI